MTITLVDSITEKDAVDTFSVTPSGTPTDGNLLLCGIAVNGQTVSTVPSGWTLVSSRTEGNGNGHAYLYYKVADSESGSYTWTMTDRPTELVAGYMEFSNVNTLEGFETISLSGTSVGTEVVAVAANDNDESLVVHVTAYDPQATPNGNWTNSTTLVGSPGATYGEVVYELDFDPPGSASDTRALFLSANWAIVSAAFYFDPGISSVIMRRRRMR